LKEYGNLLRGVFNIQKKNLTVHCKGLILDDLRKRFHGLNPIPILATFISLALSVSSCSSVPFDILMVTL